MSKPMPPRPEFAEKPKTTWWTIVLAAFALFFLLSILTVLTLGWFGPIILLVPIAFAVFGLQYLVWGWYFERIYRGRKDQDDARS